MRRRLDYVILYVAHLERSVAFYRDVIGLALRFSERGYAEFAMANLKFALLEAEQVPALIGSGAGVAPSCEVLFLVEDVDAEAARLRERGARVLSGPVDRPWGHRTLHVADPDGHVVELAQEIPRAPA